MSELYVVNRLDGQRAVTVGFGNKREAKVTRNALAKEGVVSVVSRGPDHWKGASRVASHCLNKERISRRRKRLRMREIEAI